MCSSGDHAGAAHYFVVGCGSESLLCAFLQEVATSVLEITGGSPLTIRVVAGILRDSPGGHECFEEWKRVLEHFQALLPNAGSVPGYDHVPAQALSLIHI